MTIAAVLLGYALTIAITLKVLVHLSIPTWKVQPRVPRVIDDRYLTPRGYWK